MFCECKHFVEVNLLLGCSKLLEISNCTFNFGFLILSSFVCLGITNKSLDDQRTEQEISALKLANPAVLPAPQKADAIHGDYPELSLQVM